MSQRPHKYRARPVVIDGIRFASTKEGKRYSALRLLEEAGEIRRLRVQPSLILMVPVFSGGLDNVNAGVVQRVSPVGQYRADFSYEERRGRTWTRVYEDVKGLRLPLYQLKKRMVETQYGIEIREV